MIIHLLDSYCLDDDMTPIKGGKLSIARKMSSGFSKFTSSVSEKILSGFGASESGKSYKEYESQQNKNEQVALQKENKPQNGNQKNASYNAPNFSISGVDDDGLNVP